MITDTRLLATENDRTHITFSRDGKLYYVESWAIVRPDAWCAVDPTDKTAYPFAFWSIKSGERREVVTNDPLVTQYATSCGWPLPGSPAWLAQAREQQKRDEESVVQARKKLQFAEESFRRTTTIIAKYDSSSSETTS